MKYMEPVHLEALASAVAGTGKFTDDCFIKAGEKIQEWVNNHAHVLDSSDGLLLEYVAAYINAINLAPYVTGTAQPKMNQEKMNSILIPIRTHFVTDLPRASLTVVMI